MADFEINLLRDTVMPAGRRRTVFWGLMVTSVYLLGAGAVQQVIYREPL